MELEHINEMLQSTQENVKADIIPFLSHQALCNNYATIVSTR